MKTDSECDACLGAHQPIGNNKSELMACKRCFKRLHQVSYFTLIVGLRKEYVRYLVYFPKMALRSMPYFT